VVVPATKVARWKLTATTTIEGTLDGVVLGRRSLKRWDDERWFIELRRDLLDVVGKATLREEVLAVKSPVARDRRVRRALLPVLNSPPPRVVGLGGEPRSILVRILGRRLPGRTCGPYTDVIVGLAGKVGCDPTDSVPADTCEARWETRIDVREGKDGLAAFRGPAVNGPPRERFLYLTWIGRTGGAAPAMFRRAKLRLDAVPADVLAKSLRSGVLVGRLELTAADGMPVCASVRPPSITWTCS
jgi:hypothetical protein